MDSFFSVFSALFWLFGAISYRDRVLPLFLKERGVTNAEVSALFLCSIFGDVFASIFFNRLQKIGFLRLVSLCIIFFVNFSILHWIIEDKRFYFFCSCALSFASNVVTIILQRTLKAIFPGIFDSFVNLCGILASYSLKLREKHILSLNLIAILSALACFVFSDIKRSGFTEEDGNPNLLLLYMKYNRFFWISFLFSLADSLFGRFFLLVLQNMDFERTDISQILVAFSLGRLVLDWPLFFLTKKYSRTTVLTLGSICLGVCFIIVPFYCQELTILTLLTFCVGGFFSVRRNVSALFYATAEKEKNFSLSLTLNQMKTLSAVFSVILGALTLKINPVYGLYVLLVLTQVVITFYLQFS